MIITPARFEDAMREAKTASEAIVIMLETLESMGYGAGVMIWMNKFVFDSLLQGEKK